MSSPSNLPPGVSPFDIEQLFGDEGTSDRLDELCELAEIKVSDLTAVQELALYELIDRESDIQALANLKKWKQCQQETAEGA